jgi:hypothetical protein
MKQTTQMSTKEEQGLVLSELEQNNRAIEG